MDKRKRESTLVSDDLSFPRGGGSSLTAIEYKQAANEAAQELFQEQNRGGSGRNRKKRKTANEATDDIKTEGLLLSSLKLGVSVLGQVASISDLELTISLPNGLIGHVPITNISSFINDKLESDDNDDEEEEDDIPSLKALFTVGQWIRASVSNLENRHHIEFSLDPSTVNDFIEEEDISKPGCSIQGYVKSVEDHGIILDIGRDSLSAFVSKKDLKNGNVQLSDVKVGQIMLLVVKKKTTRSLICECYGSCETQLSYPSSIKSYAPGTLVLGFITSTKFGGFTAIVDEHLTATADYLHSGIVEGHSADNGEKVVLRVLANGFTNNTAIVSANSHDVEGSVLKQNPLDAFPVGSIVDVKITMSQPQVGLLVSFGDFKGFVHVSRIADGRVDLEDSETSKKYSIGAIRAARILSYSFVDNVFTMSMQDSILNEQFLTISDATVGMKVEATVVKFLPRGGLYLQLSKKIFAVVNEPHLADVKLRNPEKKFKVGQTVKGRILSVHPESHKLEVTLKKSLINYDGPIVTKKEDIAPGMKTLSTVVIFKPHGVVVELFGGIKAYLPASEMSEAYIDKPEDHFHLGQSLNVRVVSVDDNGIVVSCRRVPRSMDLVIGELYNATVIEKRNEGVTVELSEGNTAIVLNGHLSDSKVTKTKPVAGESIEVLLYDKDLRKRILYATAKPSLIRAAQDGRLLTSFDQVAIGQKFAGWVKNITDAGIFVGFANNMVGLATKKDVGNVNQYNLRDSVEVTISDIDTSREQFLVSFQRTASQPTTVQIGDKVEAVVQEVKETQLNVTVGENTQGRIDISQLFDDISEIADEKRPLSKFKKGDTISATVVGYHDARTHRFLPISHRSGGHVVLELCARARPVEKVPEVGSNNLVFVNNAANDCIWVSLSPLIKGKIPIYNFTHKVEEIASFAEKYVNGSALVTKVIDNTDPEMLIMGNFPTPNIQNTEVGQILPGVVVRTNAFSATIKCGDISAFCHLLDIDTDFSRCKTVLEELESYQVVPIKVLAVDVPNKKVHVSMRSDVVSGGDLKRKLIIEPSDVSVGDILDGFVKNVANGGLFVSLGFNTVGRVQIKNLSDGFLEDWKKNFQVDQPVKCIVISTDQNRIELSLKESIINGSKGKSFASLIVGDIYEGSVSKVEGFGVFVKLDGVHNVTGLCHNSEISDQPIDDPSALFSVGDVVKVKVLNIDEQKGRLALGMKASYFDDADIASEDEVVDDQNLEQEDEEMVSAEEDSDEIELDRNTRDIPEESSDSDDSEDDARTQTSNGLSAGFDWNPDNLFAKDEDSDDSDEDSDAEQGRSKRTKKAKKHQVEDKTADLATRQPQSVDDFERVVVSSPNSSVFWIGYMAFQLQLSEVEKAREIARRALKTISFREEEEKFNVSVALLNLENSFGTEDSLESALKEALQRHDQKQVYLKLASIYAQSEKLDKAEEVYRTILKKYGGKDIELWDLVARFYINTAKNPSKARKLLEQALMVVTDKKSQINITKKFAQMEYTNGDIERGRTLFEGLVGSYPKRTDIWHVFIDQEIKKGQKAAVEALFERAISQKLTEVQAKSFLKKWLEFEKDDEKAQDYVKARAVEFVKAVREKNASS